METCSIDGCENMVEGRTEYCASHGAAIRKAERQSKKFQVVTPVKKISSKQAKDLQDYGVLRRQYLEAYPACEVTDCHNKSSQIHHKYGRSNANLLDTNLFMAVCVACHERITTDSKWAIAMGYSFLRTKEKPETI